ncbi:hypothetical protein TVAG_474740 [Trichomonas vaginalis G3]|uniref:Uncharacterized protein n=1 Tax=Trichomonas vaginalis (strain ATCC PRA-98 / G3) TaxID=412133 RepID=A2ERM4_TRIV3|nr:protein kinase protein [Trichomonas vaginalis G3]EAY04676.1 hypothetical protein TVAG_474740 [Trichomonas vaginalis G3]KAI5530915.1 protein kinase protein [Trichomonas vaginalis G3]|eukprot:XP_001316899.1 hypothetical protein [Trichomonas vaginalis G3]
MEGVNLDAIGNPNCPEFIEELEKSPDLLTPKQAHAFFTKLFDDFKQNIPLSVAKFIIKVIMATLDDETILSVFISGGFAVKLPVGIKGLRKPICDFLYSLMLKDINSIDTDVVENMITLIHLEPSKVLTLIAYYSENFEDADDPWPMLDLLFTNSEPFEGPDIAEDYISLLTHLVKNYKIFRRERIKHVWKHVTKMLQSLDLETIRFCYICLTEISKYYEQGTIDPLLIKKHLKSEDLHQVILSFLIMTKTDRSQFANQGLLSGLIKIAAHNINATLVLMELATNPEIAQNLASLNGWILKKLPTVNDTLRLVLVLFKSKASRKILAQSEEFPQFLQLISKTRNSSLLSAICMLVRRLPISQDLITQLSESGFIETFYSSAESSRDETSLHAFLLLTDRLLDGGYVPEYVEACDIVADILKEEGNLLEPASFLAVNLAAYKKCKKRLIELEVDSFFEANAKSGPLKKVARQFLATLQENT